MSFSPGELSDRASIQDALTSYSIALDHPGRRWDLWYEAFSPDAVLEYEGMAPLSPAEAQEIFDGNTALRISIQHLFLNTKIDLQGDTADARSECLFFVLSKTDRPDVNSFVRAGLWFEDKLARTPEGWRIVHRKSHNRWSESSEQKASA